jgi:hypothetical protein
MWSFVKRILLLISFFFLYVIVKEFLSLYAAARTVHPWFGYGVLIGIGAFLIYFVILPAVRILGFRQRFAPARDPGQVEGLIRKRMRYFHTNPYLRKSGFDLDSIPVDRDGYYRVIEALRPEMERIRKKYVTQVFYTTSIAQNGFLDALFILSASVNLIKELFILYHGKVSNRDLWTIARKVYYSVAIGGSEGVESATDEILAKVFSTGVKSIPFASRILGSLADGVVNAALLTRVALITENYCTLLFIDSTRALYPSYKTVLSTTKILTGDLLDRIAVEVRKLTKDKAEQMALMTVNPVGTIIGKALGRYAEESPRLSPHQRERMRETSQLVHNPFGYVIRRISGLFRRPPLEDDDLLN